MANQPTEDVKDQPVDDKSDETESTEETSLEETEVSEEDLKDEEDGSETEPEKPEEETQEEESADEETESEDTPEEAAPDPAQQAFKDREAKRLEAKQQSQQDYLDEATDDQDLALRQLQVDAYNNKIEFNNNKLQNGIDKAIAGIDLFHDGTPDEIREELAASIDDFERMYVTRDRNGDPIDVRGDVYEFLSKKADSIRKLTGVGARKGSVDKAKAKSRTMAPPSAKPKEKVKDPDMEAFEKEAASP